MKRSIAQDLPSQEARSKMTRHDPENVEETPKPTTNIFLVETVLRRLFKQIESVSKLKVLRGMCQLWDRLDTDELEERAFQGRFKPINLTFFNEDSLKFNPIKDSISEMRGFLDDTSSNPRLFRSFAINFPCSLALLNLYKFRWFYTDYSPTFLELAIPTTFKFSQDKERLLKELIRWAAPALRELVICSIFVRELNQIPTRKSLPVQSFNFPFLRKVNAEISGSKGIVDIFKFIFAKENQPETPFLTSFKLRYRYSRSFLDLIPSRWATLTKLDILYESANGLGPNRFTNGLLSLAHAGMTLKKLHLGLRIGKEPGHDEADPHFLGTCRNLNQFFASQAGSLEALKLSFKIYMDVSIEEEEEDQLEGQIKIQLPVFEQLHTLSLDLYTRVYTNDILNRNIFEFDSISRHFPALENLNILKVGGSLDAFFGGSYEEEERMNLKCLKGMNWGNSNEEDGLHLDKYFGSVEVFACSQASLQNLRMLGDLVDTIRVLHIRDVNSELDLSQFKGLRRVVIEEDDLAKKDTWMQISLKLIEGLYLGYFKKVAELRLDSIKFKGLVMIKGESYKEFAQAFPFRVEFEEKPVDWFEKNFIDN